MRWKLLCVLALLLPLALPLPAKATGYHYELTGWSWDEAWGLTACFYGGDPIPNPGEGGGFAYPLPDEYRPYARRAVDVWNEIGVDLHIHMRMLAACGSRTDVVFYAFDEAQREDGKWRAGQAGCRHVEHDRSWMYTPEFCYPASGVMLANRRLSVAGRGQFWLFVFVHELGHVWGLDHPGCAPDCADTVMSAAACPRDGNYCRPDPTRHDIAGLRAAYTGQGGGGGQCLVVGTSGQASIRLPGPGAPYVPAEVRLPTVRLTGGRLTPDPLIADTLDVPDRTDAAILAASSLGLPITPALPVVPGVPQAHC